MKVYVSTGALIGIPNGRDFRLLKEFSKRINCDGFEFMMYSDWYNKVEDIVEFIRSNNINIGTYHCQKSIGEAISKGGNENFEDAFNRFEVNAKMAKELGSDKMVIHLWDGITSDRYFENNLEAYKTVREIADKNGQILCVENVVCNQKDPMVHWTELREKYPDISFVFDTKMAEFHGQVDKVYEEEFSWLWKENHIKHLHVNDFAGKVMDWESLRGGVLPIGKGHVDFDKFFKFIKEKGYDDTITLEATAFDRQTGVVDFDMLNKQVDDVHKLI